MAAHQRIASFKRPASSLKGGGALSKPRLFWEAEELLYIGWGCSLRARTQARTFADAPFTMHPQHPLRRSMLSGFMMRPETCSLRLYRAVKQRRCLTRRLRG